MKRIKVFIDAMPIASSRISGVGHYTHEMIKNLAQRQAIGHRYELILVATARSMPFVKSLNIPGVSYRSVWLPHRVWNRLAGIRGMLPIDVFFGKGIYLFPNYRRWPLLRSPSATFIYDLSFIYYPEFATKRSSRFLVGNIARWADRSNVIVTISTNSKNEIVNELNIPSERIKIAYPGVDTKVFYRRSPEDTLAIKKKYDLPDKFILYLGNIEPRKNLARLVRAYSGLSSKVRNEYPLVLVGGAGWMSNEIEKEIAEARGNGSSIIKPSEYIIDDDLPALYSAASLLAHPAIYEGFGISLVQAMACGVPVLCGNQSSMPEVVGSAAILVDPLDEDTIRKGLEGILTDKEVSARLTKLGPIQAAKFTWQENTGTVADILSALS